MLINEFLILGTHGYFVLIIKWLLINNMFISACLFSVRHLQHSSFREFFSPNFFFTRTLHPAFNYISIRINKVKARTIFRKIILSTNMFCSIAAPVLPTMHVKIATNLVMKK